jgi:hypothetical protein
MAHDFISIDTYNNAASCRLNNTEVAFPSASDFITAIGFPFQVGLLSWEPVRCHWVVEKPGTPPTIEGGSNLPEIVWIDDNLERIRAYSNQIIASRPQPRDITVADIRNNVLQTTDWVLQRHQEEQLLNLPPSLSDEKFQEFLTYRQALRDMTKTYTSLTTAVWPVNPLE